MKILFISFLCLMTLSNAKASNKETVTVVKSDEVGSLGAPLISLYDAEGNLKLEIDVFSSDSISYKYPGSPAVAIQSDEYGDRWSRSIEKVRVFAKRVEEGCTMQFAVELKTGAVKLLRNEEEKCSIELPEMEPAPTSIHNYSGRPVRVY